VYYKLNKLYIYNSHMVIKRKKFSGKSSLFFGSRAWAILDLKLSLFQTIIFINFVCSSLLCVAKIDLIWLTFFIKIQNGRWIQDGSWNILIYIYIWGRCVQKSKNKMKKQKNLKKSFDIGNILLSISIFLCIPWSFNEKMRFQIPK
jgi:hypothetical protein